MSLKHEKIGSKILRLLEYKYITVANFPFTFFKQFIHPKSNNEILPWYLEESYLWFSSHPGALQRTAFT